jgi:DNA polymerase III delta subunit
MRAYIAKILGLTDAYTRIMQLEIEVERLNTLVDNHESNLMILHKESTALKMEADIINKKISNE